MAAGHRQTPHTPQLSHQATCARCSAPVGHHAGGPLARRTTVLTCPLSAGQAYAIIAAADAAAELGTAQ